ncbi:MAG TPA: ABC transporter permease [Bryobacteraceae bacterium]|nr:ABC transporter permease [Bryobacteraceae bacterium]
MFELFIARRYLRAKRKQVVISVITAISVIGVAAGVMALVVALAINNGFRDTLERNLLGATAHVSILEKEPGTGIENWEKLAPLLAQLPHVKSAAPALYESGYLSGPLQGAGVAIKGVDVRPGAPLADALLHLKAGSIDELRKPESSAELPGIILGSRLAQNIGAVNGKQVQLTVPNGELTPFGPRPGFVRFRVAGIFESGFYDLDANWAFTSLPAAQKAFDLADVVNSIELMLDDIYEAPGVAGTAERLIGPKLAATTWGEQNRQILNALSMERMVTVVTIGLIQLVAALNILITLVMMVMEKHRDIAILMSMGAKAGQIRNIFVYEGALIGAVGTVIGLAAGYSLCYFADRYHWVRLDQQVYSIAYVPFEPRALDGLWIAAAAMAVSLIATLYPARSAASVAPAESLRYE